MASETGMTIPVEELLAAFRRYLAAVDGEIVRDFLIEVDWEMPGRALDPNELPCLAHLSRAAEVASGNDKELAQLLAYNAATLRWGQTYTAADFGPRFVDNYGWMELFGTRGHFVNDRLAAGFLLLGPEVFYPDHHHIAEEIYIPLTGGAEWRMAGSPFQVRQGGEVIHHASGVSHAMRTGREPLLALYLWRGGSLAQRPTVTGLAEGAH
jgi:hypothetical protein